MTNKADTPKATAKAKTAKAETKDDADKANTKAPAAAPDPTPDTTVTEIEWGEPPETARRGSTDWFAVLAPFRDNPGQWGKLPGDHPTATATAIRRGKFKGGEEGKYEVRTKTIEGSTKRVEMWVRYRVMV